MHQWLNLEANEALEGESQFFPLNGSPALSRINFFIILQLLLTLLPYRIDYMNKFKDKKIDPSPCSPLLVKKS